MKNISMDLDYEKYLKMESTEIIEDLNKLKKQNINAFIIPYELFANEVLVSFKDKLLKCIADLGFGIILRAQDIRGFGLTYEDEKHLADSIMVHVQFLANVRKELAVHGIDKTMGVIFAGGIVKTNDIEFYIEKSVDFFKILSEEVESLNIDIILELSHYESSTGRRIGNRWSDIKKICDKIDQKNFGICWNMKNSRINASEYKDDLIPEISVFDRIKIATIVNTLTYDADSFCFNAEMQFEEIKALIMSNFQGTFYLEYVFSFIHENDLPYQNIYDGIEYFNYILIYFERLYGMGKLEVNLDFDKMKRKFIRREFTHDTKVILESTKYQAETVELSINDVRITSAFKFNNVPLKQDKIVIKIGNHVLELDVILMFVRTRGELYDYIYKITNVDRPTRKKLCEVIYLTI